MKATRSKRSGADLEVPEGVDVHELPVELSPGLIALWERPGVGREGYDSTRRVMADAELAHAFNAAHADFRSLREAGVTTVVLSPTSSALSGGITATVKTSGAVVLKRRTHLHLGFGGSALSFNRYPTSYSGAVDELNARFTEPKGVFAEAKAGRLPVLMDAFARHEVQRALAFAAAHKLTGTIAMSARVGELAQELKQSGLSVVISTFTAGNDIRGMRSAVQLAEAGVPFGFASSAPYQGGAGLRLAAAAAMREGLDRGRALRALTSDAASIAGVADRVGRIAPGMDADMVAWTGDPTDLTSAVFGVMIGGEIVVSSHDDHGQEHDHE